MSSGAVFIPMSSNWIDLNLLSLNMNLVVDDQDQTGLIKLVEKQGLDMILLKSRHTEDVGWWVPLHHPGHS
jgi:hypothetical protein